MTARGAPGTTRARGSVSVLILATFVLGAALMFGAARLGAALLARARAETAADAAALAAADALALGHSTSRAATDAATTASENGATLEACECAGPKVTVTVVVDVPVVGRVARVRASAEVHGTVLPAP